MRTRMIGGVSFDNDVRALFRAGDRDCMVAQGIDLWDWWTVRSASDRILGAVEAGFMPPDAPWSEAQLQIYRNWVDEGFPKMKAEVYAEFFRGIDAETEYSANPDDPNTSVFPAAKFLMGNLFGDWMLFAGLAAGGTADLARKKFEDKLKTQVIEQNVLKVDDLICRVAQKVFSTSANEVDGMAITDAFENFARDRLPLDSARAANSDPKKHPPGEPQHHRLDSTSMWFFWTAQMDAAITLKGLNDPLHQVRRSVLAGLVVGCPMDIVFRDSPRQKGDKTMPKSRPEYKRDAQTEEAIRTKGKLFLDDANAAIQEMMELFRIWKTST